MRSLEASTLVVALALAFGGCDNSTSTQSPQRQLITAAIDGDRARVELLLNDPSVDINSTGSSNRKVGETALGSAAISNQVEIARLLLQRGAEPNAAGTETLKPLHSAAYHGYTEIVRLLICAGADVNAAEPRYQFTPLAFAARNSHIKAIKLLLDAGADRNAQVSDGRTALEVARQYKHSDAADVLESYQPRAVSGF